jgi:hypothetical protein
MFEETHWNISDKLKLSEMLKLAFVALNAEKLKQIP